LSSITPAFRIRKIGHAGTLDPGATGLILILLGEGTKLSRFLMDGRKVYRATIRLGTATDTYDADGEVTATQPLGDLSEDTVRQALAAFRGVWTVARVIREATGAVIRFHGLAVLVPEGGGLRYHEAGRLAGPMGAFRAERRYLWEPCADGIAVRFADGRFFHVIGAGEAVHPCGADLYRGGYDFARWPEWRVTWAVEGPAKAYVSTSVVAPLASAARPGP